MNLLNPASWFRRKPQPGAIVRTDGWANDLTGLGTAQDKTTAGYYVAGMPISETTLSSLYHHNDTARNAVDAFAEEVYREGFDVTLGDPDIEKELADDLRDLDVEGKFQEAIIWGRLYGGAAIILGAEDGGAADQALVPARVRQVEWLRVADKRELAPHTWYETGPKAGEPETYRYIPLNATTASEFAIIHESRMIFFGGARTGSRERLENGGWDFSVLQAPTEALCSFGSAWSSIDNLLADGQQPIFKTPGLAATIGADGESDIKSRWALLNKLRSNVRAMVLDAGNPEAGIPAEEFERQTVSFTDLPALLDKIMLRLASSLRMPVTILMGQSPAGMNATGESDMRWFYARVANFQRTDQTKKIRRLVRILLESRNGPGSFSEDTRINVTWPPLWSETPNQKAQTRKLILEGDAIEVNAGILLPEEVALARHSGEDFDAEIVLDDKAIKVREAVLKAELKDARESAKKPKPEPPPLPPPVPPGQPQPPPEVEAGAEGDDSGELPPQ